MNSNAQYPLQPSRPAILYECNGESYVAADDVQLLAQQASQAMQASRQLCFQNDALSRQNAELTDQNAVLSSQLENTVERQISLAHLKEELRYDSTTVTEDAFGHPIIFSANCFHKVVGRPLSSCRNFDAVILADYKSRTTTVQVTYLHEDGRQEVFTVPYDEWNESSVYHRFCRSGGSITYGKHSGEGTGFLYRYLSGKLSRREVQVVNRYGWFRDDGNTWQYAPRGYEQTQPLLTGSQSSSVMYSLINWYAHLLGRLPKDAYIDQPFCFVYPQHNMPECSLSLEEKPTRFADALKEHAEPLVFINANGLVRSAPPSYAQKTNCEALLAYIETSHPATVFVLAATDLAPFLRDKCIAVEMPAPGAPNPFDIGSLSDCIGLIEKNPEAFDAEFQHWAAPLRKTDLSKPLSVLWPIAGTLLWFCSISAAEHADDVEKLCKQCLAYYRRIWDNADSQNVAERFKASLIEGRKAGLFHFLDLEAPDYDFAPASTVPYDEYYLYFSDGLLQRVWKRYMPDFMLAQIKADLRASGLLLDSQKLYFTLPNGTHLEPRMRAVPRDLFRQLGQRDIVSL